VNNNHNSDNSYKIDTMAMMNDLPAEIIWEIFDRNPKAGLQLAHTNKWFSEVLKDKIKKYRQLIRECNVAAFCYRNSFHEIIAKEYRKAWKHNLEVTSRYVCYFYCVHCFCSFHGSFTFYFIVRSLNEIHKTGIILCDECTFKYYGEKRINERIKTQHSVSIKDLVCEDDSDDSSDDSNDDNE